MNAYEVDKDVLQKIIKKRLTQMNHSNVENITLEPFFSETLFQEWYRKARPNRVTVRDARIWYRKYDRLIEKLPDPFIAYRGLNLRDKTKIDFKNLGFWWTLDYNEARPFKVVITGQIRKRDINHEISRLLFVEKFNAEKEFFLKSDKNIKIIEIE